MSDLNAKWAELVKAGKAEWMPGMRAIDTDGQAVRVVQASGAAVLEDVGGVAYPMRSTPPDWYDPATLGCLLALVREAWGDSDIYFGSSLSTKRKRWSWVKGGGEHIGQGDTEAEALLAALEAAP